MVEKLYSVLFEILHAIRIWKNRARKAHLNVLFFFLIGKSSFECGRRTSLMVNMATVTAV